MKIVKRKISELKAADYNPRKISDEQLNDLKNSIQRLGELEPVVVNMHPGRENIIISGHQRIKAAKELGYKEFPCYEVDFDESKEKEANIRMNRNTGEWDLAILLSHFEQTDLIDWGFEDFEIGGVNEDLDYDSLNSSGSEEVDKEIDSMEGNVKKAIQIEFEPDDYETAKELFKSFRDEEVYLGGLIIKKLSEERENVN